LMSWTGWQWRAGGSAVGRCWSCSGRYAQSNRHTAARIINSPRTPSLGESACCALTPYMLHPHSVHAAPSLRACCTLTFRSLRAACLVDCWPCIPCLWECARCARSRRSTWTASPVDR
jgi:hypothetical protein